MKRFVAVFLALTVCISLCACGSNSAEPQMKSDAEKENMDILIKEPWRESNGSESLSLFDDGTGTLSVEAASMDIPITWEIEDDNVYIKAHFTLDRTEEDGILLKGEDGEKTYIPVSQYESLAESTKYPTGETLIEIVNNEGEIENLTAKELNDIQKSNGVKFKALYFGAPIKIISTVKAVHGSCTVNGYSMEAYVELEGGWEVEAESAADVLNLNPGDTVMVTGNIFAAIIGTVAIYAVNGHSTSIELYSE